jgi:glycosyltransferase involved in cell wall biosynthesis
MRVLYVGQGTTGHDLRFIDGWRSSGADVTAIEAASLSDAELRDLISQSGADVVQTGPLTKPGARVARLWDGPLIATSWGFDLLHDAATSESDRSAARATLARADVILVDNNGPQRVAVELGARPDRIVQFPWGIDARWFAPPAAPRRSAGESVILSTRRHEPIYRVGDLVEAFVRIAPHHPGIRLRLAGSGSLTAELRALAGPSGRIDFLGELDNAELPAVYRDADLYVSTSSVDGTSVSLLEAMASACTVVVARIEGNAQWVTPATGYDYPVGDVEALASLLGELVSEGSAAGRDADARAAAASALVRERADWAATVRTFPALAERALAQASARLSGVSA